MPFTVSPTTSGPPTVGVSPSNITTGMVMVTVGFRVEPMVVSPAQVSTTAAWAPAAVADRTRFWCVVPSKSSPSSTSILRWPAPTGSFLVALAMRYRRSVLRPLSTLTENLLTLTAVPPTVTLPPTNVSSSVDVGYDAVASEVLCSRLAKSRSAENLRASPVAQDSSNDLTLPPVAVFGVMVPPPTCGTPTWAVKNLPVSEPTVPVCV